MPSSSNIIGTFKTAIVLACLLTPGATRLAAQSTAPKPSTPLAAPPLVVEKLKSARRISVAEATSHGYQVPLRVFTSDNRSWYTDEDYFRDQVINTVEMWRQYQVVPMPAGADVVLEPSIERGAVRVGVRDTRTRSVLWIFSRTVKGAFIPAHQDQNLAEAISSLLDDVRRAAGQPLMPMPGQPAPPSVQLPATPKVFISFVGEPFSLAAYDWLYAGIKSLGRFELVMTPAEADLIFEAFDVTPLYIMLVVRDPKTNITLLVTTRHVPDAILPGNRARSSPRP